ncbi:MAG: hypothetical protein VB025_06320 [Sphaerochaeta sp.]|nr:hypothetical protein [Sphaerochaeta sp.]
MKRCRIPGTVCVVLILASLFALSGCGIPNYLNLDDEIAWQTVAIRADQFETNHTRITINTDGLTEIEEKVDSGQGPGLKFFYSLSDSPSEFSFPYSISSRFATYMKGGTSGTGNYWTLESSQKAPGFFLFKPTSSSGLNPLAVVRPSLFQVDTSAVKAIVGTFAISPTSDDYSGFFRDGSDMDIPLNRTTGTIDLKVTGVDSNTDGKMKLLVEYGYNGAISGGSSAYLLDYMNKQFPFGTSNVTPYINSLRNDADDSPYWNYLDPAKDLYLHIWVSLYGGAGFTNIYWSDLKYLGSINLFKDI